MLMYLSTWELILTNTKEFILIIRMEALVDSNHLTTQMVDT